ncbi:uncharacterized protein LOC134215575 [Armigeres subalbatus]|uniref:uncharacterized protein LOC134215575 n=1 Tax=Armigeres subalbatus TaxID=124917 RepID=UPI002ED3910C
MAAIFTINGKLYKVSPDDVPVDTSLNSFIRNHAYLTGTKFMCLEGGCGACIVNIKGVHPVTKKLTTHSVNSCLYSVFSCHGLDVVTVEGIGSKEDGYHPVQRRLAYFNGTQCGFCSPGMVMSMYSLVDSKRKDITMNEIENIIDGNICRCTGYRPILDAFKSFACDVSDRVAKMCGDIEDIGKVYCSTATNHDCSALNYFRKRHPLKLIFKEGKQWHKVYSVDEILKILAEIENESYILVGGNTGHGVYRRKSTLQYFIDVSSVEELYSHWLGSELIVGANVSLTEFMSILLEAASKDSRFKYCTEIANHVQMIAHSAVRNVGSLAGNLMLKQQHHEFPSDLYIILETVGAHLTIINVNGMMNNVTPQELIEEDMNKKILTNIVLPALDPGIHIFKSYKVQPRAQNAKAYVNAAFLIKLSSNKATVSQTSICYGGIHPSFTHAIKTEKALVGKYLFKNETIQEALKVLETEMILDWVLPDPNPVFRKQAALGLFYRFVLSAAPKNSKIVDPRFLAGTNSLERPVSSGFQSFDTYPRNWPLTKNIPKIEALAQTSGEAQFINDIPHRHNELHAAFVTASQAKCNILRIDATRALALPGVVAFFSANDIPGRNDFMPLMYGVNHFFPIGVEAEEVLCSGKIAYYGQPIGIIVAESFEIANQAISLVDAVYSQTEGQIYATVEDVVKAGATERIMSQPNSRTGPMFKTTAAEDITIKGKFYLAGQYHYSMETQSCLCIPQEDGMDVYSSTQWPDQVSSSISLMLNISQNRVNYHCRRVGGAFGSKISRSAQISSACALAAYHTHRPVRFVMSIEANMSSIGKRQGCWNNYEVSVTKKGKILKLSNTFIHDSGCSLNEPLSMFYMTHFKNCYDDSSWRLIPKVAITDVASNTWLRGPGSAEAYASIETIFEHIAHETGLDPSVVRLENIPEDSKIRQMYAEFQKDTEFKERRAEIERINSENRWRKRGISMIPLAYQIVYGGPFDAWVAIHHLDGSVSITHSGVEMGQGINTKAVQVAAYVLKIPLEKISVKPLNSMTSPNGFIAGGSNTTDSVAFAVMRACETLVNRIRPIRETNPAASWEELVSTCFSLNISLVARHFAKQSDFSSYTVWAMCCTELELDVLTGACRLARVDILEDTGESMSPGIDIGQIEGAFMMGVGYFLTEHLVYDKSTGALINNRTWNYKPPSAKDIPTDFRIKLLQNSSNPTGVLRSKATGEPAYNLGVSALFALRYALLAARKDSGLGNNWLELGTSMTIDKVLPLTGSTKEQFIINFYDA